MTEHTNKPDVIETRDPDNNRCWRIIVNGVEHPAYFRSKTAAESQFGLLRSRGFAEAPRAA